jgi:hypothetical protein
VLRRRLVRQVEHHLGRRERHVDGPLLAVGLEGGVDFRRLVQTRVVDAQLAVVRLLRVFDLDESLGLPRCLERFGDDRGDELAAIRDAIRLEQRELDVVDSLESWRVLAREDSQNARQRECS